MILAGFIFCFYFVFEYLCTAMIKSIPLIIAVSIFFYLAGGFFLLFAGRELILIFIVLGSLCGAVYSSKKKALYL